VNDYHLLLLPALIRKRLPGAIIGFFLHVAFPSSEIFRCLSVRQPLLHGLLGADLIGFQTANHARHFRQTVSRILSLEATPKGIQGEERFVDVGVFPMGIDVAALAERK
jgi:trehalose-6-phosphate synthase